MTNANLSDLVSVTDLARSASKLIGRLLSGESEQMVILRNNKPAAVIMSPEAYERMSKAVEEIEMIHDLRIAEARDQDNPENDLTIDELKASLRQR